MQLRPKIRLPTLLIGVNLAVLIIAIVGIATVAIGLLLELGDDQGLARVRQGVAIAQNDVHRSGRLCFLPCSMIRLGSMPKASTAKSLATSPRRSTLA